MDMAQVLRAFVGAFIDELVKAGVRHVVFSPGSRSTPLILMAAEHDKLKCWRHIDERSAGFFALGLAKALDEPVALLCSSGTAAANFYPAVVEAYYDRVPLVVLTADRPHELRDMGAPQTIDQHRLYGAHAKWFVDLPLPEESPAALRYVRTIASRAVALTRSVPSGPVHLNFPFREPLIPALKAEATDPLVNARAGTDETETAGAAPVRRVVHGATALSDGDLTELLDILTGHRRGLIVCGPQRDARLASEVAALAQGLGFPILADPLSGVRYGSHDRTWVIDAYDALLRDDGFAGGYVPDIVLRFGAMPTSKALALYLQRHHLAQHIVVDEGAGWRDPGHLATRMVYADPVAMCQALTRRLPKDLQYADRSWGRSWCHANSVAHQAIAERVGSFDALFEGRIFSELADLLPPDATLYVGNSMPVRDLDSFLRASPVPLRCLANRGANGIDGVVSSSLGVSAAAQGPVVLVIGDLSFYHDLGGLLAATLHQLDLTVVLVNNDGGGIFSFLPQSSLTKHFEPLFGTPHGLHFAPAVKMYGGTFDRIRDWDEFKVSVRKGLELGGLHVVEVPTSRVSNTGMHQEVWQAVRDTLAHQSGVRE